MQKMGFKILRHHQLFGQVLKFSFNSYKLYVILLHFLLTLRLFSYTSSSGRLIVKDLWKLPVLNPL
jgi:hypothetical protein